MMIQVAYPTYPFKIKQENGKDFIFDAIRKKWFVLTPEEWVRQNFIQYLIQVLKYPSTIISIEKEITVGELKKRYDIVVFKDDVPWMLIECKEMKVDVTEKTLQQILVYNQPIQAQYLVVTNGNSTMAFDKVNQEWLFKLPHF